MADIRRGLMHGAAGAAALLALAAALHSLLWGLVYIVVFGVGSIVGMTALSAAIAAPLVYSAELLALANRGCGSQSAWSPLQ